jgi:hypothetical protein
MPAAIGIAVHLAARSGTAEYERRTVETLEHGTVAEDLREFVRHALL